MLTVIFKYIIHFLKNYEKVHNVDTFEVQLYTISIQFLVERTLKMKLKSILLIQKVFAKKKKLSHRYKTNISLVHLRSKNIK